jgi:hypothetical protein
MRGYKYKTALMFLTKARQAHDQNWPDAIFFQRSCHVLHDRVSAMRSDFGIDCLIDLPNSALNK